ncbi:MAG: biotin synthase [Hydrogenophaga sp.]
MHRAQSPWLHEEVANRMLSRLQWFRHPPDRWLHWAPLVGGLQAHQQLRAQLPQARCFVWPAPAPEARSSHAGGWRLWRPRRTRSEPGLPDGEQVAMLWANMWLHHEPHPMTLLRHWHGLLGTEGFLMFSCLGPDTLRELRSVYARQDWPLPGHAFTDMHDWGDMLMHSGFAEPVMDMEHVTLSYSSAEAVLDELRGLGRNFSTVRPAGLRGRSWRTILLRALEDGLPRDTHGRLLLTFELIYGHAYKPLPRLPSLREQTVSVDAVRGLLRDRRR